MIAGDSSRYHRLSSILQDKGDDDEANKSILGVVLCKGPATVPYQGARRGGRTIEAVTHLTVGGYA